MPTLLVIIYLTNPTVESIVPLALAVSPTEL
jgi:hypothetical protein